MAYIRERQAKKPFQVRYYIDGKEKAKSFKTKREAKDFKKEIEAQKILGIAKDESNIKFKDYAEMVFKKHDRKASFQTKQNRRYYLNVINDNIGNIKLKDISATKIETFFSEMAETKSDQVLIKYKQIINIAMESAFKKDLVIINPMLKVEFVISQENLKDIKPIKINDFIRYIEYAKQNIKYSFGLWLMLYTGMRIGEVLALRLDDFDFENNVIYIIKSRQRNGEIGPVKGKHNRKVPIHEKIAELYYEVDMWHKQNKRLLEEEYNDNNLFISNEDGKYVSYNAFRMYLRRLDEKVGVKLRPHQLRHTFATFMRGMEIKDIQKMTGHKDVDTLVNVYQEHDGFKDETIQSLDESFKSIIKD